MALEVQAAVSLLLPPPRKQLPRGPSNDVTSKRGGKGWGEGKRNCSRLFPLTKSVIGMAGCEAHDPPRPPTTPQTPQEVRADHAGQAARLTPLAASTHQMSSVPGDRSAETGQPSTSQGQQSSVLSPLKLPQAPDELQPLWNGRQEPCKQDKTHPPGSLQENVPLRGAVDSWFPHHGLCLSSSFTS